MRWLPPWLDAKLTSKPSGEIAVSSATDGHVAIKEKGPATCKDKARALVHKYAAFGTAWAILPIPIGTSVGLTALETHLIYWISRIYGEELSARDVAMTAGGLELASVALKTVAVEGATFVPVIGWGIKAGIAGSAIEGIGQLVIDHFEKKYPGKAA